MNPKCQHLLEQAITLHCSQQPEAAKKLYLKIVAKYPTQPDAWHLLGLIFLDEQSIKDAHHCVQKAIQLAPKTPEFYNSLGNVYRAKKETETALQNFKTALRINPNYLEANLNLGILCIECHRYAEACVHLEKSLKLSPNHLTAGLYLSLAYRMTGSLQPAIDLLEQLLMIHPNNLDILFRLGVFLGELEAFEKAVPLYQRALSINPTFVPALIGYAALLEAKNQLSEALALYEKALSLSPNHPDALNNIANIYRKQNQLTQSLQTLFNLVQSHPNHVLAYNNIANIYADQGDLNSARKYYDMALNLEPNFIIAKVNLAHTLAQLKLFDEAKVLYQQCLETSPSATLLKSSLINDASLDKARVGLSLVQAHQCDWSDDHAQLLATIKNNGHKPETVILPFESMALNFPLEMQKDICIQYAHSIASVPRSLVSKPTGYGRKNKGLTNIAYISPDFGDHPVGLLIKGLFSLHDKSQYKTHALSLKTHHDAVARCLEQEVDHFIPCSQLNDQQVVSLIQEKEIDILIDLSGHTRFNRPGILLAKPAPVQAHWIGYPGTLGMPAVDYYITHPMQVPETLASTFTEKLAYLPNTLIACADLPPVPETLSVSRADFGLPENAFVFCCFHLTYRIDEPVFDAWMSILREATNSVLWLASADDTTTNNLKQAAMKRGVEAHRLIFSPPEKMTLRFRQRLANVWLDTFILSGGTGAILCHWSGVPVLTMAGDTPQSRTGACINTAAGLPELIANSPDDYIQKAIKLATEPAAYQIIKDKSQDTAQSAALFDASTFVRDLECLYQGWINS